MPREPHRRGSRQLSLTAGCAHWSAAQRSQWMTGPVYSRTTRQTASARVGLNRPSGPGQPVGVGVGGAASASRCREAPGSVWLLAGAAAKVCVMVGRFGF
jgi:hypothetical protein